METVDFNNEETVKIASDGVHESNNSNVESEHLDSDDHQWQTKQTQITGCQILTLLHGRGAVRQFSQNNHLQDHLALDMPSALKHTAVPFDYFCLFIPV